MAAVTRRTDSSFNRCIDIFPGGRIFAFFKDTFLDDTDLTEFIIVKEVDDSTTYISDPGVPLVNADWDEWVRINVEGDFDIGDFMTPTQLSTFNLATWWTWIQRRRMVALLNDVDAAGWTPNEKRKGAGGALAAAGVPIATAQTIGDATTSAADIASVNFTALGLVNIPPFWRTLLRDN